MVGPALYYALGGGLGHITRARALLTQWGVQARVLVGPEPIAYPQAVEGLELETAPPGLDADPPAFRLWLEHRLRRLQPSILYLDSFPAGLLGEFCGLRLTDGLRVEYIARRLRWDNYRRLLRSEAPKLDRVHVLEPLEDRHRRWLTSRSEEMAALTIEEPEPRTDAAAVDRFRALAAPRWLVVHSGPDEETGELLAYARESAAMEACSPNLLLVTPAYGGELGPREQQLACYPAQGLFPLADRIISACGFNIMRQTLAYRERHRCLPMPRRFDDQFARAAEFRPD